MYSNACILHLLDFKEEFFFFIPTLQYCIFTKTNYKDIGERLASQRTSQRSAPCHALLLGLEKAIKSTTCFSIAPHSTVG